MFKRPHLVPGKCSGDPTWYQANVLAPPLGTRQMFRRSHLVPGKCSGVPTWYHTNVQVTHIFSIIKANQLFVISSKMFATPKEVATHSLRIVGLRSRAHARAQSSNVHWKFILALKKSLWNIYWVADVLILLLFVFATCSHSRSPPTAIYA